MSADAHDALPYRPCVGVMLVNDRGEVFVGQRIDTPAPAWQMPQGGIDAGESVRAAALRELAEETGLAPELVRIEAETPDWLCYDLPADLLGKVWQGRYRGQRQKWVLARFLGRDEDIDIATAHPEFSRWRWLPPAALIDSIVPFKRAVYERVLAEFRDLI
ncbi:MAG: RNA pyrophosphohydrolase [Roseovarius sp.]